MEQALTKRIEPGKFYRMSLFDYHYAAGVDWYSKTFLSDLVPPFGSPKEAQFNKKEQGGLGYFDAKMAKFHFGTAFHCYFLEPEKFKDEVRVQPVFSGKGAHAKRDAWKEKVEYFQRAPISTKDFERIIKYEKALKSGDYENARNIVYTPVEERFVETSGFWIDGRTGLPLKIRPDMLKSNGEMWDLKNQSSPGYFDNVAMDLHYDMQAAMCIEGVRVITGERVNHFGFVVFHGDHEPYEVEVARADEGFLESGRMKLNEALDLVARCRETGKWPGRFQDVIRTLSPPLWRARKMMNSNFAMY